MSYKSLHQVKVMLRLKRRSEIHRIKKAIIGHEDTMIKDRATLKRLVSENRIGCNLWYTTKTRYNIYNRIVVSLYTKLHNSLSFEREYAIKSDSKT